METTERQATTHRHPLSAAQLHKAGVTVRNKYDLSLKCNNCGEVWTPKYYSDGTLLNGYWKCPNRCNW